MEPEMVAFLKRVANSVFLALAWLAITSIVAIKGDNAFIGEHITMANILCYTWFVISIILLVWIYRKMWAGK
ncbi:MAG TPA: hypothetical protein VF623_02795 [Segetibacter sp.]|jgi:hypothetical protein